MSRKGSKVEDNATLVDSRVLGQLRVIRRMRRAYLSMCRCGNAMFGPHRMTTDQYALIRAVQRNEGMRQSELCEELFADANTITAMVSLLEKRGFIRREICSNDGRARRLYVTKEGDRILRRLSRDWEPMRQRLLDCFDSEAGLRALEILDRVCEVMTEGRREILEDLASKKRRKPTADRESAKLIAAPKSRSKTPAGKARL